MIYDTMLLVNLATWWLIMVLNRNNRIERQTRLNALENQIKRLTRRLADLRAVSDQFTRWRVGIFIVGLIAAFAGFTMNNTLGWTAVALFALIFIGVARLHGRVKTSLRRHEIWRQIKRTHIARMRLDWDKIPAPSVTDYHEGHPFALDLDLAGERSVHHLLDTAISRGGSARLLDWLLATVPDLEKIQHRQALVRELIPLSAFREKLTLVASMASAKDGGIKGRFDGLRLLRWLEQGGDKTAQLRQALTVLGGLSAVNIVLIALFQFAGIPPLFIGTLAVYALYSAFQWNTLGGLFDDALRLQAELNRLQAVLDYLEHYPYGKNVLLRTLCAPFLEDAARPSRQLGRVGRTLAAASLQRNPVLWITVNLIVPWDVFFAYQLERNKQDLAAVLPRWLDALHELEALIALATFAYLNPAHVFPVITSGAGLKITSAGHPLIVAESKVSNDFALNNVGEAVIITGSNMSGKSSFLRTLGVNLQLAYAGGVVDATDFEAGLFRVFACIRVSDSVVDGFSYFYAEVRRLKALLNALKEDNPYPLFFLIDEIFRGTNNRERLIGSRAYIRALVGGNGMGLISTHDLELVKLADEMAQITNDHFKEEVIDGRMVFDYRLRSGPSPTTNALKIMQLEGLPINEVNPASD